MKKILSNTWLSLLSISALTLTLFFTSCDKDDDNNNNTPVAGLMAFNLAADKSSIGITLSGNNLTSVPLGYTNYTGTYLSIFTGSRPIQAYDFSTGTSFTSSTYTFEDSSYYSLFIVGANGTYSNIVVEDNFDDLTNTGQAYIRYINAIPDSTHPMVTITAGSTVIAETAGFRGLSSFTTATAGSATIVVNNGGTINVNRTITLEAGKVYTVLLTGIPGNTGDQAVQIRFIENGTLSAGTGVDG